MKQNTNQIAVETKKVNYKSKRQSNTDNWKMIGRWLEEIVFHFLNSTLMLKKDKKTFIWIPSSRLEGERRVNRRQDNNSHRIKVLNCSKRWTSIWKIKKSKSMKLRFIHSIKLPMIWITSTCSQCSCSKLREILRADRILLFICKKYRTFQKDLNS